MVFVSWESGQEQELVSKDQLQELKQMCVDKIKESNAKGVLFKSNSIIQILSVAKEMGYSSDIDEILNNHLKKNANFLKFLSYFVVTTATQYPGTDKINGHYTVFAYKDLSKLLDIEKVRERIRKISDKDNIVVKMFLGDYSKKDDQRYYDGVLS